MVKKQEELIPFFMKLSPIDKHILDEIASALNIFASDVMRLALWNYVNVPKDNLLKVTLKELASSRQLSFKMDMLKELERINNRQMFFIDGFRTMLANYHSKHAPIGGVRRYVTIKLIAMYSIFDDSRQRKDYLPYIRSNYLHYYPNERKWIDGQIAIVRNLKKDKKDKLLLKLSMELPYDKRNVLKVQKVEGIDDGKSLPELPAKGRKADAVE